GPPLTGPHAAPGPRRAGLRGPPRARGGDPRPGDRADGERVRALGAARGRDGGGGELVRVQVRGEGRDEEGTGSGPVLRRPDGGPGIAASATGAATYALTGRRDGWGTPAAPRRPITIPPAPREAPPPSSIRSVIGGDTPRAVSQEKSLGSGGPWSRSTRAGLSGGGRRWERGRRAAATHHFAGGPRRRRCLRPRLAAWVRRFAVPGAGRACAGAPRLDGGTHDSPYLLT